MLQSKLTMAAAVLLASFGGWALTCPPTRTEEDRGDVMLWQKPEDYNAFFDTVLEVLGEYFDVAYANRFDGRIETSHRLEKPAALRRRAVVSLVVPGQGGLLVSVRVFKEAQAKAGWEPIGRDAGLEQAILRRLADWDRKETEERAGREPNGIVLRNVHLEAVNHDRTISVITLSRRPTSIVNLPVARDARIEVKDGSTLTDLKIGMRLILRLGVEDDQIVVTEIRQERGLPK
jgi:hypothetical protein